MKGVARPVLVLIVVLLGLVTVWAAAETHAIPQNTRRPQNGVSKVVKPSSQRQPLKKLVLQVTPSDPAEAEWREKFETVNRIRLAFGYPALNPDGSLPRGNRKQTLVPRTDAKIVKPSKVRQVRQLKSSLQKSLTPVRSGFLEVANSAHVENEAADNLKVEAKVVAITFPVPNMQQLRTECGSSMAFATGTVTTHVTGAAVNQGPHIWRHANGCTYWAEDGTRLRRILGFTGPLDIAYMSAPRPPIPGDVGHFLDAMVVPAPRDLEWFQRHASHIVQGHILADSLGGDTLDPGNFFPQTSLSNSQTGAWGKAEMIALHLQGYCQPIIPAVGASDFTVAIQTAHGLNPFPSGIVEVTNVFTYANANPGAAPTTSGMNDFIPTGGTYYVAIKVSETVRNAGTGAMVTNPVECGARLRRAQFCGNAPGTNAACANNNNPNVHPNPIGGGQWERVRVFSRRCVLRSRPHSNGTPGDTENWCVWSTPWTNDLTQAAGNQFDA